jgi:hypothetical protein
VHAKLPQTYGGIGVGVGIHFTCTTGKEGLEFHGSPKSQL